MDNIRVREESLHDWRSDYKPTEIESINIIEPKPIISEEADLENLIVEILEGDIQADLVAFRMQSRRR